MSLRRVCTELLGIQGWEIEPDRVAIEEDAVILRIRRKPGRGFRCSQCGEGLLFSYDHREPRRIRDFPWAGKPCFLEASLARVDCPDCGVVLEGLDWIDPWARQTVRYEKFVAALCDALPVTEVCEFTGLNKNAVYRMDWKWLQWREKRREQKPVKLLGIDEISLKKGHRYATVFYDLEHREVIGLVRSRRERSAQNRCRVGVHRLPSHIAASPRPSAGPRPGWAPAAPHLPRRAGASARACQVAPRQVALGSASSARAPGCAKLPSLRGCQKGPARNLKREFWCCAIPRSNET